MLRHAVVAECRKLKGSCIWLAFLFLPAFSVFVGSANFSMNRDILTKEWQSLWTQVSLFYGDLFLAVLLSIYAAYAWRLEHLNHNWNNLMTAPVPVRNIFWSKFLVIAGLSFVTQVFFLHYTWRRGSILDFNRPFRRMWSVGFYVLGLVPFP